MKKQCKAISKTGNRCKRNVAKGKKSYCKFHSLSKNRKASDKIQKTISVAEGRKIISRRLAESKVGTLQDISKKSAVIFKKPNQYWAESKGKNSDVQNLDDGSQVVLDKFHYSNAELMEILRSYKSKSKNSKMDMEQWGFTFRINLNTFRVYGLEKKDRLALRNKVLKRISNDFVKISNEYHDVVSLVKNSKKLIEKEKQKNFTMLKQSIKLVKNQKNELDEHIKKYHSSKQINDSKNTYQGSKIVFLNTVKFLRMET